MKKKINYTDEHINMEVIDDFLPPPDKLALKPQSQKVTITLSKASVEFFKENARKYHFPYQKMIREVLDGYVAKYQKDH